MSNGGTYGFVRFLNEKYLGLVSGIVGAGGNLGGLAFGFLFKSESISYVQAFEYIGVAIIIASIIIFITKFTIKDAKAANEMNLVATSV
jgi:NNP family nitrate/nitrite transporter-like MFS transporter